MLIPARNRERHDQSLRGDLRRRTASAQLQPRSPRCIATATNSRSTSTHHPRDRDGEACRVVAFAREIGALDSSCRRGARNSATCASDAILDQIEDACAVVDLAGHYRYVNNAFCRLFGRARESWSARASGTTPESDERIDKLREVYAQVWKTGTPIKAFEYQHDGQRRRRSRSSSRSRSIATPTAGRSAS